MKHTLSQLDLAKAFGKHQYQIMDLNYREKILNHPLVKGLFTIGKYFVMVGNMKTMKIEYLGGDCKEITGFTESEINKRHAEFLMSFAIPEDLHFILEVVKIAIQYLQSRPVDERDQIYVIYFYRARKKKEELMTIEHQSIPILFDAKTIPYVFTNILTEISHLGLTNIPQSTLINRANGDIFHINPESLQLIKHQDEFSEREKEIIRYLAKGLTSKQIANQLHISYETARTHRKNILKKAGLINTAQLIGYAITQGLI
jgi:DNA-binding CsgD family transcriptional regulator